MECKKKDIVGSNWSAANDYIEQTPLPNFYLNHQLQLPAAVLTTGDRSVHSGILWKWGVASQSLGQEKPSNWKFAPYKHCLHQVVVRVSEHWAEIDYTQQHDTVVSVHWRFWIVTSD